MVPPNFSSKVEVTFIGTATAIINIDGINFLTDPSFDEAGTEYDLGIMVLKVLQNPAIKIHDLPCIDAVLLSHEDHPDNLDKTGRTLLEGRTVVTTADGAKNLKPRPSVHAIHPWETIALKIGGKDFKITGTPCKHLPGGEVTGFILETDSFGKSPEGLPNAIYISGDTVYLEELAEIRKKFHIALAVLHLGSVVAPTPEGPLQITLDAKSAAQLIRDIEPDTVVPIHFDSWRHFVESSQHAAEVFEEEGLGDKVIWVSPGETKRVL
ncbi:Zn-dependent hydrolase of the beta-lactamase fold protein [Ceratobasidium theobromae]|uniref:Zn-dependent hydrolase of the beta-lactamase fold protein n=1 Tax=Ceratobasidium theobromae TaxID=1582974 RepID=A0A5N5Q984_9AGAM|nr:Zn-dependent hydrolase of the beta-lactamase fold protein [Ceratobasidium theobromae]